VGCRGLPLGGGWGGGGRGGGGRGGVGGGGTMPLFLLYVKADMENCTDFGPASDESHWWTLDLKQSDGPEERSGVAVSSSESVELKGNTSETANFVMKWSEKKFCSINVVQVKGVTRRVTAEDVENQAYVPLVGFECRGCEPTRWDPGSGYTCKSTKGARFDDIDLSEGEWMDYDADHDLSVLIENVQHKFELHKEGKKGKK